jgi:hypothetical protein
MKKKESTNFEEFEGELLQDPEIRKEYENLKPKYDPEFGNTQESAPHEPISACQDRRHQTNGNIQAGTG